VYIYILDTENITDLTIQKGIKMFETIPKYGIVARLILTIGSILALVLITNCGNAA
jgi:hypothetical protein